MKNGAKNSKMLMDTENIEAYVCMSIENIKANVCMSIEIIKIIFQKIRTVITLIAS
jgi:hypothetical protein